MRKRTEEMTAQAQVLSTMGSPPNTEARIHIQVIRLLLSGEKQENTHNGRWRKIGRCKEKGHQHAFASLNVLS